VADFCLQCDPDFKDFVGMTTPENARNNLYAIVLCEGCGYIQVDPDGACICDDCLENHSRGHQSDYFFLEC
jgi:hypothetical protein